MADGIFQSIGYRGLADHRVESLGPVFSRRNNEIIHIILPVLFFGRLSLATEEIVVPYLNKTPL
jgi:hypothetical protein